MVVSARQYKGRDKMLHHGYIYDVTQLTETVQVIESRDPRSATRRTAAFIAVCNGDDVMTGSPANTEIQ